MEDLELFISDLTTITVAQGRRKITITSNFKSCNLFEITRTNRKL